MKTKTLRFISLVAICAFIITTCKKDEKVTDLEITAVTVVDNTVKVNGKIISLSGNKNGDYGVAYSIKNNSPVITDTVVRLGTPTVGTFSAEIKDLKRNKTYYFRGFIKEGDAYLYDNVRTALITAIPPVATTKTATSVAETAVTLNGSVNPNGTSTTVSFEYGTTTAYGSTIAASTNILTGSSLTDITAGLTGLTPNTTYHFRVKATNIAGTVTGEDLSFITLAIAVAPVATSAAATSVTNTTASLNGSVNANGSSTTVSFEYGTTFLYGSAAAATPATASGITPVTVTSALTGLPPGQLYHFRVKAVSAGGTTYGEDLTFTTTQPPTATTQDATNIAQTYATLNGQVNANGKTTAITFEWGTSTAYGNVANGVPDNATGTTNTASKADITGLTYNTTYHFRVKAVSSDGTTTGSDLSFKTVATAPTVPILSTTFHSSVTSSTAKTGGEITSNGGALVTARGVCWGTASNPTLTNYATSDGTGSGIFISNITGLTASTTYYIRAYATNSVGTAYGNGYSFNTLAPLPAISTLPASSFTSTSLTTGGNITSDGGAVVSERGVCWNTASNPTILNNKTYSGAGSGSFSSFVSGLSPSTQYYIRAYATNSGGTGYGDEIIVTTPATDPVIPILTTATFTTITTTTATGGGNISNDGGSPVLARGICYRTTSNPTIADSKTVNGTGGGTFTSNLTGLTHATTYYVRAYATNAVGTGYGPEVTFTSLANLPTVTTSSVSIISSASTNAGGTVTADGGAAVSARGVCWSTSINPTILNSITTDGTGTGTFTSIITGLTAGTTYSVRAYATNSVGTNYGSNITVTAPANLTDVDGNVYSTVSIDGQVWMQSNLKVTRYEDGTNLVQYTDTMSTGWSYYHAYNESTTNLNNYGYLYNGYVVAGTKDLCPLGWHLPTITDWTNLSTSLGGSSAAGGKMKDISRTLVSINPLLYSYTYWTSMTGDNSSRFYGRGGGYYFTTYADIKNSTIWWASTSKRYVRLDYNSTVLTGISAAAYGNDDNSFYIRCKKD